MSKLNGGSPADSAYHGSHDLFHTSSGVIPTLSPRYLLVLIIMSNKEAELTSVIPPILHQSS